MRDPAEAVGPVVGAIRRLAAAANPTGARIPEELSVERYTALIERLARPNQARLRAALLASHGARCVVSGCTESVVLDAAHIEPVAAGGDDAVENGLLLRADLHRLFDAGLLTITGDKTPVVLVAEHLPAEYQRFCGARVPGLSAAQRARLRARNAGWMAAGLHV